MFSQADIVGLLTVYGYVAFVVAISMFAKRRYPNCGYRKLIHILIGNIVFVWWIFDSRYVMAFLAAAPFIILLLLATPWSPLKLMNDSFLRHATSQGHSLGLVYYAISWTILAFFLFDHRAVAGIGILAMSYGDGLGGLIGKSFGKRKLWKDKTVEGTMAVFLATTLSTIVVYSFYEMLSAQAILPVAYLTEPVLLAIALAVGAFVAVVELFSPGELDNIIVPLSTAALLLPMGL